LGIATRQTLNFRFYLRRQTLTIWGVTIDFLIRDAEFASIDKETVDRITGIQQLDHKTKSILR